ncbi:TRAP transporter small permease [Rhodospirillaceae bacterium KN72]|uniref:TRAP transporter small permease protein n=1 Tax=Pacificispira spongiicola TaxID=2729598 RepID=A0A7Y0HCS7_9PROT|nr:TRAP transporter small permease [Pacificispira spongiicola]NMM43041.1 TRAP transporter small permease [Pacificispira spongiicola]
MSKLVSWYDGFLLCLGYLGGICLGLIAVMVSLDVILRNIGTASFPWLLESVEYALFAVSFLLAPWVLNQGSHVRVDVLVTKLPGKWAHRLDILADTLGFAVCALFTWYGSRVAVKAFERGELIFKELIFPEWWLMAILPVAGILLTVEFARRLAGHRIAPPLTEGL